MQKKKISLQCNISVKDIFYVAVLIKTFKSAFYL